MFTFFKLQGEGELKFSFPLKLPFACVVMSHFRCLSEISLEAFISLTAAQGTQ